MPARLSKNQYLDAKRIIKESKAKLSNEQVVKRAKLGSEKVVPMIRKARSYPHYCELVREKNRAAARRRDDRKNGQQSSLLAVDEPTPKKPTKIEVNKAEPKPFFDEHESKSIKKAIVDPEEDAAMRERIGRDRAEPLTQESINADLMRRMSAVERGQRSLFAGQKETNGAVEAVSNRVNTLVAYEEVPHDPNRKFKVKRKKLFGIF